MACNAMLSLLLAIYVTSGFAQESLSIQGELVVFSDAEDEDEFYLTSRTRNGTYSMFDRLFFPTEPRGLITGDILTIQARDSAQTASTPQPSMRRSRRLAQQMVIASASLAPKSLIVDSFQVVSSNPAKDFDYESGALNISSVIVLMKMCGQISVENVTAFKALLFNDYNPTAGSEFNTMQNFWKECSFGKARFDSKDNMVLDLQDTDIGCSGKWRGILPWTTQSCGIESRMGWLEAVQKIAMQRGIDTTKFQRTVLILPPVQCKWDGMGTVGCGPNGGCFAWVKGSEATTKIITLAHELAHNIALQHATGPNINQNLVGYGDYTDVMGETRFKAGERCFSAPHSWQLGWSSPVARLSNSSWAPGTWSTYTLPALTTNSSNHIQITPDWGGSSTPVYFLSYREAIGWDQYMREEYLGRIHVHVFNGTQGIGPFMTEIVASVDVTRDVTLPAVDTVLKYVSKTNNTATISLCRKTAESEAEACFDGLDNDCDGVADGLDDDCEGINPCNQDGTCDEAENAFNCPSDCPSVCGDGLCSGGESSLTCVKDCPGVCGDVVCNKAREDATSCPQDCQAVCGDGLCDLSKGENFGSCALDCASACGDDFCDAAGGETLLTCPADCTPIVTTVRRPSPMPSTTTETSAEASVDE